MLDLRRELGRMDVYLLDQVLKGRFPAGTKILDAGCGGGRNLTYFLRQGYPVWGVDRSEPAVAAARRLARETSPGSGEVDWQERFRAAELGDLPFADGTFDAVLSSAVLHFARDEEQFRSILDEMWRVLAPGGLLFARLASRTGLEAELRPLEPQPLDPQPLDPRSPESRRFHLPDGSERFLVDDAYLLRLTEELAAEPLEPIKTVNVQNLRCMATWVLRKGGAG